MSSDDEIKRSKDLMTSDFQKAVLSQLEGLPVEDNAEERFRQMYNLSSSSDGPKKQVSFVMDVEEANQFYFQVLNRLRDGVEKEETARAIVEIVQQHLKEKELVAYGHKMSSKRGSFRRSE